MPVPVFCCFCISGFPDTSSAPKIPENLYKKSAERNLPESPKEGRRGPTRAPGALVVRPRGRRARDPPGSLVAPLGAPLHLYLPADEETPTIDLLFPFSSLYRRHRRFKIGAAWRSCPGTLPEGGTTFGRPSIAMDASRMCRE